MKQKFCFTFIYKKCGQNLKKKFQHLSFAQRKTPSGSLNNTFLHEPCKFEQNRSRGTREILTTARGLADNGLLLKIT